MYGTERCGYCKKQKALLGDSFANVNYVDCDENPAACTAA
jgi:glutaredoxin